jgi:RNA polymerase sigma-70 factor (ECF subfamily)
MQAYAEVLVENAFIEHRSALVRRLTAICRDPEAAQDIAQEAFLRLAREVEAGRAPDNPGAWLHRVGSNLAMSHGRRVQVATRHEAELPRPAEPVSPERIAVESELASAVGVLLDELSQTERRALVLAANGVGGIEIASSLGRTPGATRTLLCRARAKLRERMRMAGFAPA